MITEIRRRPRTAPADFGGDVHPVLRRVYAARGVVRAEDIDLSLERLLPVSTLEGVERAAELLAAHRAGRVLIVGDFDADGATGSALLVRALRGLKFAHVDFLVPNRFRFGYGLTPGIVAEAAARRPTLIVTVDNGVCQHRRCGGRPRRRNSGIDHRSSSAGRGASAGRCHRQSEFAGCGVCKSGVGRRRRGVLRRGGAREGARPERIPRHGLAGFGGARHRGGHGAARSQQPGAGGAGAAAHSRRALRRRESAPWSSLPGGGSISSRRPISDSWWRRGSTPPAGSPT